MANNKIDTSKIDIRKIVSDAFDKSGLNPALKNEITQSAAKFTADQIKLHNGEKICDDESFELSEDLLFKLLK